MVLPYQIWMLQRVTDVLRECRATDAGRQRIDALLDGLRGGSELLELDERLSGCRVRREHARIFSVD